MQNINGRTGEPYNKVLYYDYLFSIVFSQASTYNNREIICLTIDTHEKEMLPVS